MTNNITGIDIRKALVGAGLKPSDFNEQGIYNHITSGTWEGTLSDEFIVTTAENFFRVKGSRPTPDTARPTGMHVTIWTSDDLSTYEEGELFAFLTYVGETVKRIHPHTQFLVEED